MQLTLSPSHPFNPNPNATLPAPRQFLSLTLFPRTPVNPGLFKYTPLLQFRKEMIFIHMYHMISLISTPEKKICHFSRFKLKLQNTPCPHPSDS